MVKRLLNSAVVSAVGSVVVSAVGPRIKKGLESVKEGQKKFWKERKRDAS